MSFDEHIKAWKKWKKKEYDKMRYAENIEKVKKKSKKWAEDNKERARGNHKKWYEDNKSQKNDHVKKYRDKNREKSKKEYGREYQRLFRLANPELVKQRNHKYYWDNPEKHKKDRMLYYWEHRDQQIQKHKDWRKNNIEKVREYRRKYQIENRDKINAYKRGNKPAKIFYPERYRIQEEYKKYKREYDKIYRLKNKEKKKQIDHDYYLKNKEKHYLRAKEYTKIHRKNKPEIYLKSDKKRLEKIAQPWNMSWLEVVSALTSWSTVIRKNKVCENCKNPVKYAHHILYKKYYPGLCLNENNGISLCQRCHWEVHGQNLKGMKPLEPVLDIRQYAWMRVK